MVQHLYPHFLSAEHEYQSASHLWRSLLAELAATTGSAGQWRSWRPSTFVDGSPIPREIWSIADAYSPSLGRAITIIQRPPVSDCLDVTAWIARRADTTNEDPCDIDDLTLSVVLSKESLEVARMIIASWMDPSISRERMEDIIEQVSS